MDFEKCAEDVKNLKKKPTNDELLELYALYKQTMVGDNETTKPWAIDIKSSAKWNSWIKLKGTSQEGAKRLYVELVRNLIDKYGL